VIDLLSSVSLARTNATRATARHSSLVLEDASEDHQVNQETIISALNFLTEILQASPDVIDRILRCYPGIILRNLLKNPAPEVVHATAVWIARLADGNAEAQRYLRLEEGLVGLVPVMVRHAEAVAGDVSGSSVKVRLGSLHVTAHFPSLS
jgi:hypothetical protein